MRRHILLLATAGGLAACAGNDQSLATAPPNISRVASQSVTAPNGFTVDTVVINETTQLTAALRSPGHKVRTVVWTSRATAVATVTSTGLARGVAAGQTYIVASNGADADSLRLVVTDTTTPPQGTRVEVGQSIQAAVDANPSGTSFVLAAGVHRMQSVVPKDGDTFTGETGAVMNGSRLLTTFTRSGSYWVASGQTQDGTNQGSPSGICRTGYERCIYPWDVYRDNAPLRAATSLASLTSGGFYFDFAADAIYLFDDPTGHTIEAAVTQRAFGASSAINNVTIQGLVIEKYASFLQQGAIDPWTSVGWVIQNNDVRFNHGEGIRIGSGGSATRVVNNNIHHQGMVGVAGFASGALVDNNEIAWNNYAGVNDEWAAGGMKVTTGATDLTVSNNRVHDNDGRGLWCDGNCLRITYSGNTITGNMSWAIQHEISCAATIRNNTIDGLLGGGVFISTSRDVEIYSNTITNAGILTLDQNRGTWCGVTAALVNLNVHDNTVSLPSGRGDGQWVGTIDTKGSGAAFGAAANNHFTSNHYTLSGIQRPFAWLNAYRTWTEWQGYGHDLTGTSNP